MKPFLINACRIIYIFIFCTIFFVNHTSERSPLTAVVTQETSSIAMTPRMYIQSCADFWEQMLQFCLKVASVEIHHPEQTRQITTPMGTTTITHSFTHQPNKELIDTAQSLVSKAQQNAHFWRTWNPSNPLVNVLVDFDANNKDHHAHLEEQILVHYGYAKSRISASLWNNLKESIRWYHVTGVLVGCCFVGYVIYKICYKAVRDAQQDNEKSKKET